MVTKNPYLSIVMKAAMVVFMLHAACFLTSTDAQSISSLWKSYCDAEEDYQPKKAIEYLHAIEKKAEKKHKYGDLLIALLTEGMQQNQVSRDSATAYSEKLIKKYRQWEKTDGVLATVFKTVLCTKAHGRTLFKARPDIDSLLASPDAAAYTKKNGAKEYVPMVEMCEDSEYFGHDLLSVIGIYTGQLDALYRYYSSTGNRKAACLLASYTADTMEKADSLIALYQDLPECGELAVVKAGKYDYKRRGECIAWIDEALNRWGSWKNIGKLRNMRNSMTCPRYETWKINDDCSTDTENLLHLSGIRNMNGVVITVSKGFVNEENEHELLTGKNAESYTFSKVFKSHNEWEEWDDTISLGRLPLGLWEVKIKDKDGKIEEANDWLNVSDLGLLSVELPDDKYKYIVVNRVTGHPVPGAMLHYRKNKVGKIPAQHKVYETDGNGEYVLPCPTEYNYVIYATNGADSAMKRSNVSGSYDYNEPEDIDEFSEIYTDRAIYRPGQTVHASVICYTLAEGKKTDIIKNKSVTLTLRNARGKQIKKETVTTDAFGTASVDFVLPEDERNGRFRITANNKTVYFSVEEYKRPTFEVKLAKPDTAYKVGDTLNIKGTATMYSGVPVANARVAYSVKRNIPIWWRVWSDEIDEDSELVTDTVYTNADGTFTLRMPMLLPERRFRRFYSIKAEADVTDNAGESHQAAISLPVSREDTFFGCNMPDKILADTTVTVKFALLNNIGKEIKGTATVAIDGKAMPEAKCNTDYALPADIASGKHTLVAICGKDTVNEEFVVFRRNDVKPMVYTHDWWYQSDDKFSAEDGTAWIQMATSDEDVYAVYVMYAADKVLESGSLKLSNSVMTRTLKYKEEYGDGVVYTVAWMKNGRFYSHTAKIRKPLPSNKLTMKWTTFRNKLIPGQSEQWVLNIKNPDGTVANAQLMAVLYDKSLDALKKHRWQMFDYRSLSLPDVSWDYNRNGSFRISAVGKYKYIETNPLQFSTLRYVYERPMEGKKYVLGIPGRGDKLLRMSSPMMMAKNVQYADALEYDDKNVLYEVAVVKSEVTAEEDEGHDDTSGLRTEFAETAFFMPQLQTDAKGNVALKFTLPESVTTWKFMGLAHDAEMRNGLLTDEAVAQKQMMVQPRMPRFLRQGDKAEISATVANLSDKKLNVTVTMTLLDAKTEKKISAVKRQVTVNAGSTGIVTFPVDAAKLNGGDVICRIMADAGKHRDGEQHLLPILSDMEEVVNTRTYTIYNAGDSVISLQDIMPEKEIAENSRKLTVAYTDSPAWMMVQTLDDVKTPENGNAISLVTSLYANVVTAALKDTALYNGTANVMTQLQHLQNADGSFSWWQGMSGSSYMTMAVAKTLARMKMLAKGSKTEGSWLTYTDAMLNKAMNYMAKDMAEDVERMKKSKKNGFEPWLSNLQLDWLYTLTIEGRDGGATAKYLLKLVEDNTKKADMATKAVAAVVMYENGRKKNARTFAESIKQHTVYRADVGRYFDSYCAEYSWCNYRIPTQTMCIEALSKVTPNDRKTITEMQRWLLSSKRTQQWSNPYNTVNAVHAFFGGDATALKHGTPAVLKVDGKPLAATIINKESALEKGCTENFTGSSQLTVCKETEGESWVSVYMSCLQKSSDVSQNNNGIKIKREVIAGNNPKVGDKVKVILTIEADRDYDFVTVTDNRAACLEPTEQLSGYRNGCYNEMKDKQSLFHFNKLAKGTHTIKTTYYIERKGTYSSGSATAVCAYADEFRGTTGSYTLNVQR